jgi:hypothetical protein
MLTEAERVIAARTVYGEARGEPLEGKIAVAWVIRNRVRADLHGDGKPDWWGEDVISVCHKRWQFSCWNGGDPNLRAIAMIQPHDPLWLECLKAVDLVDSDGAPDPTGGATHYHAALITTPHWAAGRTPTAQIGRHLFYKGIEA